MGVYVIIRRYTIVVILSLLLITSSFGSFIAKNNTENSTLIYGIIVPLPSGQDTTIETFENSRVRNMINDLLRLDVSVYWSNENFTALSKKLDSNDTLEIIYGKGTFIITFSGEAFKDAIIISIISDYNQTHELDAQHTFNNEIYLLEEEININCSKLVEPKLAQHFEKPVRYGLPTYLKMAEDGGFFNYEFLIEGETQKILNNENFNVLIWPYLPHLSNFYQQFITFLNTKSVNSIRHFIKNGGGFIGTCYGAYVASSGFFVPRIFSSLVYAHNPSLNRVIPYFALSLSDSIMKLNLEAYLKFFIDTQKVVNINHPVFYGVNETFQDFFKGPIFARLGKNTQPLTVFTEIKPYNDTKTISNRLKNMLIGRTSWVNSTFGKGKLILYGSHPDFVNNLASLFTNKTWDGDKYYGRRIVHNSIFFVTSEDTQEINYRSINSSFVDTVIDNTNNLSINNSTTDAFTDLYDKIDELFISINSFNNSNVDLKNLFLSFESKGESFTDNIDVLNYTFWLSEMYTDYLSKSKSSIDVLAHVLPMLYEYNNTMVLIVERLNNDLFNWLNKSENIFNQSKSKSFIIKEELNSSKISFIIKNKLPIQGRFILQNYEKCLKYLPKLYFELLKLLRNSWYNYEAYIALNSF